MTATHPSGEFPTHAADNRRIWDANALWWDDRIGDGNDFQTLLIEPATERLLEIEAGDRILDVACGAGRFARRMAALGARVVGFDQTEPFVRRARERTPAGSGITYHVTDATDTDAVLALATTPFDKAVCTMSLMDMPEIAAVFAALSRALAPGGIFVFSVLHPCFHSAAIERYAEIAEERAGRHAGRSGVKVSSYRSPFARQTEGIVGQPTPQWLFHRPISALFRFGFDAGFVVTGLEEPGFPAEGAAAGVRWREMPDIPPVMAVRMKLAR
jgi:SAM-dependent methyltransferase